jgi:hypothetical protein
MLVEGATLSALVLPLAVSVGVIAIAAPRFSNRDLK